MCPMKKLSHFCDLQGDVVPYQLAHVHNKEASQWRTLKSLRGGAMKVVKRAGMYLGGPRLSSPPAPSSQPERTVG